MTNFKHGMHTTPEYHAWDSMVQRCTNPENLSYKNYGRRGIKVCKRWLNSFENFYKDMGLRPKGKSLDRKNNDKGYYKKNCRWATQKQQANNKRVDKISINGEEKTLKQWAKKTGVPYVTLWRRYNKYGLREEKLLKRAPK